MRSSQAGTLAEEANQTVRLVSIKGPRSAESTRNPSPATRQFLSILNISTRLGIVNICGVVDLQRWRRTLAEVGIPSTALVLVPRFGLCVNHTVDTYSRTARRAAPKLAGMVGI